MCPTKMKLTKFLKLSEKEIENIEFKVEKIIKNKKIRNKFEKYSKAIKYPIFTDYEKIYLRLKVIESLEMKRSSEFLLLFLEIKILLTYNLDDNLKKELIKIRDRNKKMYLNYRPILSRIFGYTGGLFIGFNLFKKDSH